MIKSKAMENSFFLMVALTKEIGFMVNSMEKAVTLVLMVLFRKENGKKGQWSLRIERN